MILLGPETALLALCVMVPWTLIRLAARVPLRRALAEALFAGYVLALLGVVFMPWRPLTTGDVPYLWNSVNLVPLRTVIEMVRDHPQRALLQLVGNIILFVPLGLLLPTLSTRCRRLGVTAAVGLAVSAGIELVQFALLFSLASARSVDVDDVILNVTGAVLGYLVWRVIYRLTSPTAAVAATAEASG